MRLINSEWRFTVAVAGLALTTAVLAVAFWMLATN